VVNSQASENPASRESEAGPGPSVPQKIHRIALISHDFNKNSLPDPWDYSKHFQAINKICDDLRCDMIMYALWTWDSGSHRGSPPPSDPCSGLKHVNRILFEVGDLSYGNNPQNMEVHVWEKGEAEPRQFIQLFKTSSESYSCAPGLLKELQTRRIGNALLLICGESNLVFYKNKQKDMTDPFKVQDLMNSSDVRLVLNPVHDYMSWKMWRKRKFLSVGRTFVSVWNQGKGRDSPDGPWMVCENGEIRKDGVKELSTPFPDRPDIRIGIVLVNG
jgi:hypothetical protein